MVVRPTDLVYGVNERPSWPTLITFGLQQLAPALLVLVFAQVVAGHGQLSAVDAQNLISMTALASAFGTLLMCLRPSFISAGQLIIVSASAVYLAPSLLALSLGGLPLLFGMTAFSGAIQIVISPLLRRIRILFSSEIGYLLILFIGLEICVLALGELFPITKSAPLDGAILTTTTASVALIYILRITLPGLWGRAALLIAFVVTYFFCYFAGFVEPATLKQLSEAAWLSIPHWPTGGYAFSNQLVIPFAVAALVASLKVAGTLSAVQKMQDAAWERPNMKMISRGNVADGLATIFTGLVGGVGVNASATGAGLVVATRVAARSIGYFVTLMLLIAVFCNKLAMLVIITPLPAKTAFLLFLGTSLVSECFRELGHLLARPSTGITLVTALLFGLSYSLYPAFYKLLPESARLFTGSSIGIGALFAFALTLLFHLTLRTTHRTVFFYGPAISAMQHMEEILERALAHWKASTRSVDRCRAALKKVASLTDRPGRLLVNLHFDDVNLVAEISPAEEALGLPLGLDAADLEAKEISYEREETNRIIVTFGSDE